MKKKKRWLRLALDIYKYKEMVSARVNEPAEINENW